MSLMWQCGSGRAAVVGAGMAIVITHHCCCKNIE